MIDRRHFLGMSIFGVGSLAMPSVALARSGHNAGILFFGASFCPYCRVIAPVLHDFHVQTRMEVLVASLDNAPVYPFPEFHDPRAHPLAQNVTRIPHVMVYNYTHQAVTHEIVGLRSTRSFIQQLAGALRQSSEMG